jgi:hypothetical protein
MAITIGDVVTDVCQSVAGVRIKALGVGPGNVLEHVTVDDTSPMAPGKLLRSDSLCDYEDEFEYNGIQICNDDFGEAGFPAVLSVKLSPMVNAFEKDATTPANFLVDKRGTQDITPVGGGVDANGFTWAAVDDDNEGLVLPTSLTTSYSVEMVVRFGDIDGLGGWVRILEMGDRSSDNGFYNFEGSLQFYPQAEGAVVLASGVYAHIVATRSSAGQLTAYANGVLQIDQADGTGDMAITGGAIKFFIDDTDVENEISAGTVRRIRVYNRPLTAAEVLARYNCAVTQGLLA